MNKIFKHIVISYNKTKVKEQFDKVMCKVMLLLHLVFIS